MRHLFLFHYLTVISSSSYANKPSALVIADTVESGIGTLSLTTGSSGDMPTPGRILVSSSSVPLDLSTTGSIVAGLPSSPAPLFDYCKFQL